MSIALTPSQQKTFQLLKEQKNVFITGEAGCGKSFVVSLFREYCRQNNREILVCAPTGRAAMNVHGTTLHRAFRMDIHPKVYKATKIPSVLKKTDVVLIDEISMCRLDTFDYVVEQIQRAEKVYRRSIQVVFVGDFAQLPPVLPENEKEVLDHFYQYDIGLGFAFQSPLWKEMDIVTIRLTEVVRQNQPDYIANLEKARVGDYSCIDWFNDRCFYDEPVPNSIELVNSNEKAREINLRQMKKLEGEFVIYESYKAGKLSKDLPTDSALFLKIGARVMAVINDSAKRNAFVNGSLGTVQELYEDTVVVAFDNGITVPIEYYTWESLTYEIVNKEEENIHTGEILKKEQLQSNCIGVFKQLPLRVAYAITIHKSQGQTYDAVALNPRTYYPTPGLLYVGLSRCRQLETLTLTEPIQIQNLTTATEVKAFYADPQHYVYHPPTINEKE